MILHCLMKLMRSIVALKTQWRDRLVSRWCPPGPVLWVLLLNRGIWSQESAAEAEQQQALTPYHLQHWSGVRSSLPQYSLTYLNWSLRVCRVPACFKAAVIIPVPKKSNISCLDDYRPVALTSVAMKIFERLVLRYLISKSVWILTNSPIRLIGRLMMLWLCVSTQFCNILKPLILMSESFLWTINRHLIQLFQLNFLISWSNWGFNTPLLSGFWIFLQNRTQVVKINYTLSSLKTISVGAPQGCVLSPLLYSVYTNDCVSHCNSVQIFKFADDTTLIG